SDDEPGNFWIEETIKAVSIKEMLSSVQYFPNELDRRMTELVRRKIEAGGVKPAEGMRILNNYTRRLEDTTYCDTDTVQPAPSAECTIDSIPTGMYYAASPTPQAVTWQHPPP